MDICITTGVYPPLEGGPSSLSFELARKLVTFGNRVTVVTFNPKFQMSYDTNSSFTILKLPQPNTGKNQSFNPLIFLFKLLIFSLGILILKPLKRFKIIHAMDHSIAGIPSTIIAFFTRVPLIVRFPADWLFHAVDERGWEESSIKSQSVLILQKFVLGMVKRIIVTNKYVIKLLTKYGVPKEKIVIIPNAVDTNRFHPLKEKRLIKQKLGIDENQMLILSVGRLHPSKNLDDLLFAFAETSKRTDKKICLLIVGSGPDLHRLMGISKKEEIDNIFFLGRVSNEIIHEIYQAADLFVLPSSHETFGITILEAMASGIPVIVARSGGIASIFVNKKNCHMYTPGNIAELEDILHGQIKNSNSREQFAERGRKLVLNLYSWESIARKTLSLYLIALNQ